jgi:hypothetical protein
MSPTSQKPECPEGTPGEGSPKVSRESSQYINLPQAGQRPEAKGQRPNTPRWKLTGSPPGKFPAFQLVLSRPKARSQQPRCPEGTIAKSQSVPKGPANSQQLTAKVSRRDKDQIQNMGKSYELVKKFIFLAVNSQIYQVRGKRNRGNLGNRVGRNWCQRKSTVSVI